MLRRETFGEMVGLRMPLASGLGSGMGLGLIVGEYRGVRFAGHGGTYGGGATDLELLPQHDLGWHVAFNGRGYNGEAVPARGRLLRSVIGRFFAPEARPIRARGYSSSEDLENSYLSTRRPRSFAARLLNSLSMISVKAAKDGSLTIDHEGAITRWLPDGPDRFLEEKTGVPLAASRNENGDVIRIASLLLSNVAQYEPAPLVARWTLPILITALPVILAAALWQLFQTLLMRGRVASHPNVARPITVTAAAGPWLILCTGLAWAAAALLGIAEMEGVVVALRFLLAAAVLTALAMIWVALTSQAVKAQPIWRRLTVWLFALAAFAIVALLLILELAGF